MNISKNNVQQNEGQSQSVQPESTQQQQLSNNQEELMVVDEPEDNLPESVLPRLETVPSIVQPTVTDNGQESVAASAAAPSSAQEALVAPVAEAAVGDRPDASNNGREGSAQPNLEDKDMAQVLQYWDSKHTQSGFDPAIVLRR